MDHRVPRAGAVLSIVAVIVGVLSFIYLNSAFEGPSLLKSVGDTYEVEATFDDVENVPTKSTVLVNGVGVGKVTEVTYNEDDVTGSVRFEIDGEYAPLYADATARIGERTVLGDPFLDLDPGHEQAGELDDGATIEGLPSVDFDEAFDFLDADGRAHLQSLLRTFSDGLSPEGNGERLNGTLGGLARTTEELNVLVQALEGQEDEIAGIVGNGSTVLGELGSRESALRSIVGSGRVTLDALAANTASLEAGIEALPPLLAAGESSLVKARPLLVEARPLVAKLRAIAPDLRPVLAKVGPLSRDASRLIAALKPLRVAAAPALRTAKTLLEGAGPLTKKLTPGVRNLVAITQYLAPRSDSVAAFFANIASALQSGDHNGKWLRFAINFEPGEVADVPSPSVCQPEDDITPNTGLCHNAYPFPRDALDPEPYVPGSYQRVLPFDPPPRPPSP